MLVLLVSCSRSLFFGMVGGYRTPGSLTTVVDAAQKIFDRGLLRPSDSEQVEKLPLPYPQRAPVLALCSGVLVSTNQVGLTRNSRCTIYTDRCFAPHLPR